MTALTDREKSRQGSRIPITVVIALVILGVMVFAAVAGRLISPYDPYTQDLLRGVTGSDRTHWLGTDDMGRDVLSRLIDGTGRSVLGPLCVAMGTVIAGASAGLVAGYNGGALDNVLNRFADLVYALPALLVAIVLLGILGGSYWLTVAILVFLSVPSAIRIVGSVTRVQVRLPYIDSAKTLGLTDSRIMIRHVLPNIAPTVLPKQKRVHAAHTTSIPPAGEPGRCPRGSARRRRPAPQHPQPWHHAIQPRMPGRSPLPPLRRG